MNPRLNQQLVILARQRRDQAFAHSIRADASYRDSAAQLRSLQDYQSESRRKQMHAGRAGISLDQVTLHHRFDANLVRAIYEQQRRVERRNVSHDQALARLRLAQATVAAYEALMERQKKSESRKQLRREQKSDDEVAARVYANRIGVAIE